MLDLNYENNLRIFRLAETYLNIAELIMVHGVAPGEGLSAQDALNAVYQSRCAFYSRQCREHQVKMERILGEGMRWIWFVGAMHRF